ncbi:hypothetical protein ACXWRW_11730, partial [Streptococcus pyogenes]
QPESSPLPRSRSPSLPPPLPLLLPLVGYSFSPPLSFFLFFFLSFPLFPPSLFSFLSPPPPSSFPLPLPFLSLFPLSFL